MTTPVLREMVPADVEPATELILANEWGVRREWLAYAASSPACLPVIVETDGDVVGTGVGTRNGTVGWLGTIFVAPAWRGRGLGRAITQGLIDRLEAAGTRTHVLVATQEGRRLYERMGFVVQTHYRILEAPGIGGPPPPEERLTVRAFNASDLADLAELDRAATGEDRHHALAAFANEASTKVAVGVDGTAAGFMCRAPWGGGATISATVDDALLIAQARRRAAGAGGRVRLGILAENEAGHDRLIAAGWTPIWSAPRLLRGTMPEWRPDWIWGQFNHAMG